MITKLKFGIFILATSSMLGYSTNLFANPLVPKKPISSVRVSEGQTLYQISKSNLLTLRQLYKFNDFSPLSDVLEPGTNVYLTHKKRKSTQKEFVIVETSATLRQIANQEGIRLKSLMRMNQGSSPDEQLPKGEKVFLR
jgi:LysM repeat protein